MGCGKKDQQNLNPTNIKTFQDAIEIHHSLQNRQEVFTITPDANIAITLQPMTKIQYSYNDSNLKRMTLNIPNMLLGNQKMATIRTRDLFLYHIFKKRKIQSIMTYIVAEFDQIKELTDHLTHSFTNSSGHSLNFTIPYNFHHLKNQVTLSQLATEIFLFSPQKDKIIFLSDDMIEKNIDIDSNKQKIQFQLKLKADSSLSLLSLINDDFQLGLTLNNYTLTNSSGEQLELKKDLHQRNDKILYSIMDLTHQNEKMNHTEFFTHNISSKNISEIILSIDPSSEFNDDRLLYFKNMTSFDSNSLIAGNHYWYFIHDNHNQLAFFYVNADDILKSKILEKALVYKGDVSDFHHKLDLDSFYEIVLTKAYKNNFKEVFRPDLCEDIRRRFNSIGLTGGVPDSIVNSCTTTREGEFSMIVTESFKEKISVQKALTEGLLTFPEDLIISDSLLFEKKFQSILSEETLILKFFNQNLNSLGLLSHKEIISLRSYVGFKDIKTPYSPRQNFTITYGAHLEIYKIKLPH